MLTALLFCLVLHLPTQTTHVQEFPFTYDTQVHRYEVRCMESDLWGGVRYLQYEVQAPQGGWVSVAKPGSNFNGCVVGRYYYMTIAKEGLPGANGDRIRCEGGSTTENAFVYQSPNDGWIYVGADITEFCTIPAYYRVRVSLY